MADPHCHECPLANQPRVHGEGLTKKKLVVLTVPRDLEAYRRTPCAGGPNQPVRDFLDAHPEVGVTTAVACYPGRAPRRKVIEKARKCCAPRLADEIAGKDVIALGGEAAAACVGRPTSIERARGKPVTDTVSVSWDPVYVAIQGGRYSEAGAQLERDLAAWARPTKLKQVEVEIDPPRVELPPPGTPVVIDLETTGAFPTLMSPFYEGPHRPADVTPGESKIRCYGVAWREGHAVVWTRMNPDLQDLLYTGMYPLVAHRHGFEVGWLSHFHGLDGERRHWDDTQLMAHALYEERGPGNYSLDKLTAEYAPEYAEPKDAMLDGPWCYDEAGKHSPKNGRPVLLAPLEVLRPYCGWDCAKEWALWNRFREQLDQPTEEMRLAKQRYRTVALPAVRFLYRVEWRGVAFSYRRHAVEHGRVETEVMKLEARLRRRAKINWRSDDQVRSYLAEKGLLHPCLDLDTGRMNERWLTPEGEPSIDKLAVKALWSLNPRHRKLLADFAAYKSATTVLNKLKPPPPGKLPGEKSMLGNVQADERIHATFHVAGPRTGRLSAERPGLHNFDTPLKACLVPSMRRGWLVEVDYDGIEVMIAADESEEPLFLDTYNRGLSLHDLTAGELGIPRPVAKAVNFGIFYGIGKDTLLDTINRGGRFEDFDRYTTEECKAAIDGHKRLYWRYHAWVRRTIAEGREKGYVVSRWGAVRRLPGLREEGTALFRAEHQAANHPIQSAASDLTLWRAMEVEREVPEVAILATKHDSILYETTAPERTKKKVEAVLTRQDFPWGRLILKPRVSFTKGRNWGEMTPF